MTKNETLPTAEEFVQMLEQGGKFPESDYDYIEFIWTMEPYEGAEDDDAFGYRTYLVRKDGSWTLLGVADAHLGDCSKTIAWYDDAFPTSGAWAVYEAQVLRNRERMKAEEPEVFAWLYEGGPKPESKDDTLW
jgi:hypothetical protein